MSFALIVLAGERDIDECALANVCPPHSTCINLPGTFRCIPHYHIMAGNDSEYPCPGDDVYVPHLTSHLPKITVANWKIGLDELILIGIICFVMFLTCCCMLCCWRFKSKGRRNNRAPRNAYRGMGVGPNEFLLKNGKNDIAVSLKRFSKLSVAHNADPIALSALGSDQVHPQPRALTHARPMSVHETLNNFDNIRRYNSVGDDLNAASCAAHNCDQKEHFINNFKKLSPPIASVSPQQVEHVEVSLARSTPSQESKTQNIDVKSTPSSSRSSRSSPKIARASSVCDGDLNGT